MSKKFPFYEQYDLMDCGAACLRMIAKSYGRFYSLDYLRELTYLNREGVSLLGISDAAEQIGLKTLAASVPYNRLADDIPLPAIAHWDNNHFVVVYEATDKYVWVGDPATRLEKISKEEFISHWVNPRQFAPDSGVLLMLEKTPEFDLTENNEEQSGLKYLFSHVKKYKSLLLQLALGVFLSCILQAIFPFLMQSLIDVGVENKQMNFVWLVLIAQLVLFVTRIAVEWFRGLIVLHIGVRVNIHLMSDFLLKLTKMPLRFFDTHFVGDILQRIYDNERIERFLTSSAIHALFSVANFVVFGIILLIYSLKIFLIFLAGVSLYILWIVFCMQRSRKLDAKRFEYATDNQNALVQLISGMKDIKLHNVERQKRWAWEGVQAKLYNVRTEALKINQQQRTGASLINESKNILITVVAASAVINHEFSLGVLVAIQYILGQLNGPIEQLVQFGIMAQEAKISIERMNEIHQREVEEDKINKLNILPDTGGIILENVSFHYNGPHSAEVLKGINLTIPEGKTTAIVGSSGSGKSTLLKLLLGFYPPTSGTIRVGDVDLNNIQGQFWRDHCSAVLQDGYIFSDTIANNIALGATHKIDKKRLLRAAKIANIYADIEKFPLRFNTVIGQDGSGLSEGQKQRILIARAMYKQFDYLFLDEATNALDAYNEMLVMDNIQDVHDKKTIVVIAHRLNTVVNADKIIVLEEGEIIEQGTHEELYLRRDAYFALVRNQMELGVRKN